MICTLAIALTGCGGSGKNSKPAGSPDNPIKLKTGTPNSVSIPPNSDIFYTFPRPTDSNYTISLTNTDSDLSWTILTDYFGTALETDNCDHQFAIGNEICVTAELHPTATYALIVSEWDGVDNNATLTITPSAVLQSLSLNTPFMNTIGASGENYYLFTFSASGLYTISLTNVIADLWLDIAESGDYIASSLATCDTGGEGVDETCQRSFALTSSPTTLFVRVQELAGSLGNATSPYTITLTSP